jgi:2-(1,2-epoxy-1,2-dihydrophenyl)acetyl-CoA isomerase
LTEPRNYTTIIFSEDSGIANVSLNRPGVLNALNQEMGAELLDALMTIENDPRIRCVILTGSGRAFCAGEDIQGLSSQYERAEDPRLGERLLTKYNPIIMKIREIEKPFIASVNGRGGWRGRKPCVRLRHPHCITECIFPSGVREGWACA